MLAIKINAGNDRNGNPRRGWIICNESGEFVDFVDEGYAGNGALRTSSYSSATPTTQELEVAPSVYREAYNHAYGAVERQMKRENKLHKRLR